MTTPIEEGLRLLAEYEAADSALKSWNGTDLLRPIERRAEEAHGALMSFMAQRAAYFLRTLPARVAELEEGLRPFVEPFSGKDLSEITTAGVWVTGDDLRRAATLLTPVQDEGGSITPQDDDWRPISELTMNDATGYGFRVYAPSLVDEDFNPSGTADGTLVSDEPGAPIEVARWNGSQDCWDSVKITDATHFRLHPCPPGATAVPAPPEASDDLVERVKDALRAGDDAYYTETPPDFADENIRLDYMARAAIAALTPPNGVDRGKLEEIRARINGAITALLSYQQADMDGIMVITSRQAIHEVTDALLEMLGGRPLTKGDSNAG